MKPKKSTSIPWMLVCNIHKNLRAPWTRLPRGRWNSHRSAPNCIQSILDWAHTVDGKILHQLIGSSSHYLRGFIHPRWWSLDFWTINSSDAGHDGSFRSFRRFLFIIKLREKGCMLNPIRPKKCLYGFKWKPSSTCETEWVSWMYHFVFHSNGYLVLGKVLICSYWWKFRSYSLVSRQIDPPNTAKAVGHGKE